MKYIIEYIKHDFTEYYAKLTKYLYWDYMECIIVVH